MKDRAPRETLNAKGLRMTLDDQRSVFVGRCKGDWVLSFTNTANADAPERQLILSDEAMTALTDLYRRQGGVVPGPGADMVWGAVLKAAQALERKRSPWRRWWPA